MFYSIQLLDLDYLMLYVIYKATSLVLFGLLD